MKKLFLLVISLLGLSSCMSVPTLSLPAQPFIQNGFSVLPLSETGWSIVNRSQEAFGLAKKGKVQDETYAIQGMKFKLPNFKTDKEFLRYVEKRTRKDTDPSRFNVTYSNFSIVKKASESCIKTHFKTTDKKARKISNNKESMILEVIHFTCRQPQYSNIGTMLAYSHRYYLGGSDSKLNNKANILFKKFKVSSSIQFQY